MRKSLLILFLLALTVKAVSAEDRSVELVSLGNEGFLISAGDQQVVIDGLHGEGLAGYDALPEPHRSELEAARGAFAAVDLVLATHEHGDHFDPRAVLAHLLANPRAEFVSTRQATRRIIALAGAARVRDRVHGFEPREGREIHRTFNGVSVTLFDLHHGRDRETRNLGFIVEVGGVRILHMGDTEVSAEDVRGYETFKEEFDVALVPSWYFTWKNWEEALGDIRSRVTVAMHVSSVDAPTSHFGRYRSRKALVAKIDGHARQPIRFLAPMETRMLVFPAREPRPETPDLSEEALRRRWEDRGPTGLSQNPRSKKVLGR